MEREILFALAARCECAPEDDGTLFLDAAKLVFPRPPSNYKPRHDPSFSHEFEMWSKRDVRVENLISMGAYLDASVFFIPEGGEGWSISLSEHLPNPNTAAHIWWRRGYVFSAKAFSPALALLAAALRAAAREDSV